MIYFTSDLHLGHANVIRYSKRPFANVDEMNTALIKNWNATVTAEDDVYLLGDLAFMGTQRALAMLGGLKGRKHLIFGNHDYARRNQYAASGLFEWCKDLAEIEVSGQLIFLCHYPMVTWHRSHHGSWNLHGHCHGDLPPDRQARRQDVGVDVWDYAPVSFERLAIEMATRAFKPVDHHE